MSPTPHESHIPGMPQTAPVVSTSKKGLLWPILLMVAPTILLIGTIFLYGVINLIAVSTAQSGAPNGDALFAEPTPTPMHTVLNVILFFVGAVSVIGIVPCFIIGLILLIQRLKK